jgi:hypothetical protein
MSPHWMAAAFLTVALSAVAAEADEVDARTRRGAASGADAGTDSPAGEAARRPARIEAASHRDHPVNVPEPATAALVLLGGIGLASQRRSGPRWTADPVPPSRYRVRRYARSPAAAAGSGRRLRQSVGLMR